MINILIPIPLLNEVYSYSVFDKKEKEDEYNYIPYDSTPTVDEMVNQFVLLPDGEIIKVKNYSKYVVNKDKICEMAFDKLKQYSSDDLSSLRDECIHKIEKLSSAKPFSGEIKLEYAKSCVLLSSIYEVDSSLLDEAQNDDKVKDEIEDTILDVRESHKEIRTEMDLVDDTISKSIPKDSHIEIQSCEYNGKSIDTDTLISKLSMYTFPQYLTQIDITTTLDDSYIIHTNLCDIVRHKGGEIEILSNK